MHYLDRSVAPIPACLNKYRPGVNTWGNVTPDDRQEIREALEVMQGHLCAYCECDLEHNGQHIEHFRQRGRDPRQTFIWTNLFWSCERHDSCGKHKDGCGSYNDGDLIKPDEDDPELFYVFVSDGSITVRADLKEHDRHRAQETLRIFNLDQEWGPLRSMRKIAASGYLKTLEDLQELSKSFPLEDIEAYVNQELDYTRQLPFCTVIKHVLTLQEHI